ncbi:MAG: hypothetical protein RLZZ241_2535 [Bacteroidota bacterium]|jgi:hypothetical protein
MKALRYLLPLLIIALAACEKVIEIETPSEPARLVVEGIIRVDTTQAYLPVAIKLTESNNFFEAVRPVSDVEQIVIILQVLENGLPTNSFTRSLAELEPGSGIYEPDPNFDTDQRIAVRTVLDHEILFTLVITRNGKRYAAQTKYVPSVAIDQLVLGENTLFNGDETEIVVQYTDMPNTDNFYIFDFGSGNYLPTEDTFYKDQQFEFSYFYDQGFEQGHELEVRVFGADQSLFNYMNLLVQQAGNQNGPFGTPVATVRGNIFEVTDLDNQDTFDSTNTPLVFPLGYFAIVQEFRKSIVLQTSE